MPLPVVAAPAVIVSQDTFDVAVQAKSVALAVTVTVFPAAPVDGAVSVLGANVTLPVTPFCVTVNACPPIVTIPDRVPTAPFAVKLYVIVAAGPVPLAGDTVSQFALLAAVHAASLGVAVRLTDPLPVADPTVAVDPLKLYVGVTPLCVTVSVKPPIVNVPVRLFTLVFAATLYVTVPLPVTEAPAVIVSHAAFEEAVHAKSAAFEVTVTALPVAPAATAVSVVGASVTLPTTPLWVTVSVCVPTVNVPERAVPFPFTETV